MADQFKYVINATLKLNTGSLNKLLEDVKQVDRDIKAHFEKAGGGVKVPITVDKDTTKFQGEVRRVVDGYNKGQAPTVKIPVEVDKQSISKLQSRIAEVRKQLNSLSDEQARVSVNTSLVVGRNEGQEVQKQVEGIKPTIEVKLVPNEESIKALKTQVESIKAEIQASVRAVQDNNGNLRTFGRANRNEPVGRASRGASRKINATRGSSIDRFLSDRKVITDEINAIQNDIKLLEKEEKLAISANEIQKRIDSLQKAKDSGTATKWNVRDEKGHIVKGTSTVKAENFENEINYYKDMLQQVDKLNSLKKQLADKLKSRDTLERTVAYKSPSKGKPTPRSHISADSSLGQALAEIDAMKKEEKARQDALDKAEKQRQEEADKAEKKRQSDAEKAEKKRQSDAEKYRIRVQRDNERTLKRNRQITYNRLNRGHGTAESYDRKLGYQQHLEDMPNRYVSLSEQRSTLQARVSQLKDLTGGTSNGMTGAQKRAQYSQQALTHVQSLIDKLNKDIESLDGEINVERAKLQEHVNKLYGNDPQGRKLQQALLGGSGKVNPNDVIKATVKTQTIANVKAENDAKMKAFREAQAQEELERQWSQTGAYSELPTNGRIAKLMARNQARQSYLDSKTQSVNQAKSDYDNHIRRFGGNREYAGTDLEAMLKDPNVGLEDSLRILKTQINPTNIQQAVSNKQNFQKAYSISYKDDEGNIRNIRTLTYEYTKFGEAIERGDKSFSSAMKHIGAKVGVFSLLEGAMFGVIEAFAKGIEDMVQFDAQLAEISATTKDLNSQNNQLQSFYSQGTNGISGVSAMESQVQNDTFKNAETYGVNALNTVMPIEQQVIARHNLVSGNGGYDSTMKDQIVQKIMQFSAISTGGEATPEETNDLTKDALSLYQAYYDPSDYTKAGKQMNGVFDNLTAMRMRGVNTTAVTDALAELAPDTITAGVDSRQVMSMMGSYNLADASATGEDIQSVSKTFFGALRHANTNDNLKNALSSYMGIDLNTQSLSTPDLLNAIIEKYPKLNKAQQEQFAQAFSGTSGKGSAMAPKMVKFLQATNGSDYGSFMQGDNSGLMDKAWGPFSEKLKTQWDGLVERMQEFTQLLGKLGVLDSLGLLVGTFNKVLDVVNKLLVGVQSLSDFFKDNGIINIPKITVEILAMQGAVRGLVGLINKMKFGGAIGDLVAGTMAGRFLGIKTTAERTGATTALGETMQGAESALASAPMIMTGGSKTAKVATEEAKLAEAELTAKRLKSTGVMGALEDTLVFSASNIVGSGLSNSGINKNRALDTRHWRVTNPEVEGAMFGNFALDRAKNAEISKSSHVAGSIGNFLSDALMLSTLRGKGGAEIAGKVAESGKGIVGKITTGFVEMLPALRSFGLLLTRVSVIGAVITAGIWTVQALVNRAKQVAESEQAKTQKNMDANLKNVREDTTGNAKKQMNVNIDKWISDNKELLDLGRKTQVNGDYSYKDLQKRATLSDEMQKMKTQYGLEFTTNSKGQSIIHYDNGKKTAVYSTKNTKDMQAFRDFYNNGGLTNVQKLSDAWSVSTDSLKKYQDELVMVNVLSKNLAQTMNQINVGQKAIDAQYGGITSSASLQAKIDLTQKGLNDAQPMGSQLQKNADDINKEYKKSSSQYDSEVKKALGAGVVSQSDIDKAIRAIEVAKATNQPPQTVLDTYKPLDPTNEEDAKTIKEKKYSKSELKKLNEKNSAMSAVLQTYQQYSGSQDLYNQSQDAFSQYQEQQYQYQESIKQMTAQLMVAKLGLDAMNASLQNLSAVASASKTIVDMNQNVLNTGDNSAQIGALHNSMQVSMAQMGNMTSQQSTIQSGMNKIIKDNPNQDFSLSSIYNPQGEVTSEQLAYKTLYEQSQQMTQTISSQSSAMYEQLTQMRDLVLTSSKYADTWQRVQENVQLVKDSVKQTSDFQIQMSTLDSNAQIASIGGKNPYDARNEQLVSMRDASLLMAEKLNNALTSSGGDNQKLQEAMDEIQKNEGTEFQKSFINPLNNIVKGFTNTDSAFGSSVSNFNSAVDKFGNNVSQQNAQIQAQAQQQSQNLSLPGGSVSSAGVIGPYTSNSVIPLDVTKVNPESGPVVDAINKIFAGTDLHDYGAVYADYGSQYGVDPRLMASITMAETGGHSHALNTLNNVGGIMGSNGLRSFTSIDSSVQYLAQLLSKNYLGQGLNTIPAIQSKYAPYNADNDPNHLNDNWRNNVSSYYSQMTGISQSALLGGSTVNSAPAPSSSSNGGGSGVGNGGVNGMFSWFNSVLNNTSAMHYQWGGAHVEESWNSFIQKAAADCSGLVEQVYKQFGGLDLGTTTADGLMHDNNGGTAVDRSQLQAGDMVFFGKGQSASHVGIYAGNNQMYTIDHDGMPVTKENLWSDYIGGKHFNIAGGPSAPSAPSAIDVLVQQTNSLQQGLQSAIQLLDPNKMQSDMNYKFDTNKGILLGNGNIQDIMGTSGIVSSYDSVIKQRQDIYAQEAQNRNEILYQNVQRDSIIAKMNQASASGDAPSYNELHAQLAYTDQFIQALVDNTNAMKSLDVKYAQMQQEDPRTNYDTAGQKIQGGVSVLRLMNIWGSTFGNDYFRLVGEVNNMQSQYATHQKFTDEMKKLWDTFGTQTAQYSATKMNSDQDYVNLTYQKLNDINGVMKQFAQGTQDWYSVLESAVGAQQQLRDLEQKRLDNAKNMYDWTGQGLGAYIQQKAYIQSRDYTQDKANLSSAITQYNSGIFPSDEKGYGLSSGTFRDRGSAVQANGILTGKFGVGGNIAQNPDGTYRIVTDQNLSKDMVGNMSNAIKSSTQGYGLITGAFDNNDFGFVSAHTIADGVKNQFGIDTQVINPDGHHIMVRTANQNISQDEYNKMSQFIHDQYHVLTDMTGDGSQNTTLGGGKFGLQTGAFDNNDFGFVSAHTIADDVKSKFGIDTQVINPTGHAISVRSKDQNLSQDMINKITQYIEDKFKVLAWQTGSAGQPNKMDFNQQMAGLQVVADAHNKMIDQMNQYRTAVTDGFKAGALSVDDYISKLNQLRDVQTEAKENAVNMVGSIQSGFSSALNDALTQGMQGSINSPLDFMNNIKSTLSSTISGQLTSTLLNNTGLQDVMNKITTSVTKASTSGDPNAIVNMFNNNDFGKQMQDAIAPFLPMIQQIVGSTKGIFTILKDQVYNAPSGFKIDNYMNEIASKVDYQGIKNMNPNVNYVGSPTLKFDSSGAIKTTAPSQTPTGIPTGTSTPTNGTTTQTGMPENTNGAGSAPPDTSGYTTASNNNHPWAGPPTPPPAPAPSSSGGGRTYTVRSGDNPWTIENKLGLPHGWIMQHNNINPNRLHIGQVLQYHTGGIAGVTNFASAQGLKANELSAILQKSETIFQPKQLDDLVNGAMRSGAIASKGEGINLTVNVNIEGGGNYDEKGIEAVVETAVSKAMSEFKKVNRLNNLSWKGTSY